MGYETLVDFQHWTFVAQICNLLIQAYLFKRFLFQPIKKILAKRQEEVDALQKSTMQANEEAQLARTEYESHLAQAKQEAAELVRTATAHAQKRSDAIVQEAKEEAAALFFASERIEYAGGDHGEAHGQQHEAAVADDASAVD